MQSVSRVRKSKSAQDSILREVLLSHTLLHLCHIYPLSRDKYRVHVRLAVLH